MVTQQTRYGPDLNVKNILQHCPSKEEIERRNAENKPFTELVVGIVKESIKTTKKIVVKEAYFPSMYAFSMTLFAIADLFKDNMNIMVHYAKPETKDKEVCAQIIITNLEFD